MRTYPIVQNIIPGLPQTPFRNGVGQYEGVVAHCTDSGVNDGHDTPSNERNYEADTFNNAFVHFFVGVENGQPVIMQVAPTDFKSYGAGAQSNKRHLHVELCMYDDPTLFGLAYDAYCFLLAKLLLDRGLGVSPAQSDCTGTLWAHDDVRKYFPGTTTHEDPIEYLQAHGISWDQHVQNVSNYYYFLQGEEDVDKVHVTLDGKPLADGLLYNSSSYLPVRALAEALGLTVQWDGNTNTVILRRK